MKILFSILFNALILFTLEFLLNTNMQIWITAEGGFKVYIIWWVILWLINITIKPILKILSLPLFFVFFWLVAFLINWVVLWLFDYIMEDLLMIPWILYSINWWINFIIAVAIFTILNMFYSLLFSKK
jgi:putative membrane protein